MNCTTGKQLSIDKIVENYFTETIFLQLKTYIMLQMSYLVKGATVCYHCFNYLLYLFTMYEQLNKPTRKLFNIIESNIKISFKMVSSF